MNHKERLGADETILMTVEDDLFTAYCGPEASNRLYVNEYQVGSIDGARSETAPFDIDIVFHNTFPNEGTIEDMVPELEEEFLEDFHAAIDAVREEVSDAKDPIQEVMEMDYEY